MHPRPHLHAFVAGRRNIGVSFLGGQTTIRWEWVALWPWRRAGFGEGAGLRSVPPSVSPWVNLPPPGCDLAPGTKISLVGLFPLGWWSTKTHRSDRAPAAQGSMGSFGSALRIPHTSSLSRGLLWGVLPILCIKMPEQTSFIASSLSLSSCYQSACKGDPHPFPLNGSIYLPVPIHCPGWICHTKGAPGLLTIASPLLSHPPNW